MSACQSAAKQANDALAYARSVGVGSCGCACGGACESSSAGSCGCADNGGATGGGRAAKRKSGCKRQGPGCSNAACNAAADQAIAVLDAVADRPEGLPRVTMGQIRLARYSAGFTPATGRLPAGWDRGAARSREAADCGELDPATECDGESEYLDSYGPWVRVGPSTCVRGVKCRDYTESCAGLTFEEDTRSSATDICAAGDYRCVAKEFLGWVFVRDADGADGHCEGRWACMKPTEADIDIYESCGGEARVGPYGATVAYSIIDRVQTCESCTAGDLFEPYSLDWDASPGEPETNDDSPRVQFSGYIRGGDWDGDDSWQEYWPPYRCMGIGCYYTELRFPSAWVMQICYLQGCKVTLLAGVVIFRQCIYNCVEARP